jgi:hypothetical protein
LSAAAQVYVICRMNADGPARPIKIGIGSSAKKRLATLQTSCPFPIAIFATADADSRDDALELERTLHKICGGSHLHGEWFDKEPMEAAGTLALQLAGQLVRNGVAATDNLFSAVAARLYHPSLAP